MHSPISTCERIHIRAVEASNQLKRAEGDLIDIFQEVEEHLVFLRRGNSSVFNYVTRELKLGESVAYSLISIARKSRVIPELKEQIQTGAITVTNARRIVPLLTADNKNEWLSKARELSYRQLEHEIAKAYPQEDTGERVTYTSNERVRLEVSLSEQTLLQLRRSQDLLSQSKQRIVTLEETLEALTQDFLRRHDPVEKAKRHMTKKPKQTEAVGKLVARPEPHNGREPISAPIMHEINFRDERKCAFIYPDGSRCNNSRWTEIHHITAVQEGGENTVENLITLCSAHHRLTHLKDA